MQLLSRCASQGRQGMQTLFSSFQQLYETRVCSPRFPRAPLLHERLMQAGAGTPKLDSVPHRPGEDRRGLHLQSFIPRSRSSAQPRQPTGAAAWSYSQILEAWEWARPCLQSLARAWHTLLWGHIRNLDLRSMTGRGLHFPAPCMQGGEQRDYDRGMRSWGRDSSVHSLAWWSSWPGGRCP